MATMNRTQRPVALVLACAFAAVAVGIFASGSLYAQRDEYDIALENLQPPVSTTGDEQTDAVTAKPQEEFARTTEMERSKETDASGDGIDRLITYLTIFVLAIFVGFEVITKVPPTLHTPLMSGSNAISGITIIGAILAGVAGNVSGREFLSGGLAFAAAALAMINVVGGFVVTDRMLQMFRKKDRP